MNVRKTGALLLAALMLCLPTTGLAGSSSITADVSETTTSISSSLYGLSFDDINYAADGGLYAEMLENRSFEYENPLDPRDADHLSGWAFNLSGSGEKAVTELRTESPLHENNPHYLRVTSERNLYRFANLGHRSAASTGGIPVEKDEEYRFSVWMRSVGAFSGDVEIALTRRSGSNLSKSQRFSLTETWQKYEVTFTATQKEEAVLSFVMNGAGVIEVDMASLTPANAYGAEWPGGGVRKDLYQALKLLSPSFLRFPGGCAVEGVGGLENLLNWKDTIGPIEERREISNPWGYTQSGGLGYYEYFMLAEALRAEPIPVVHAGVQGQNAEAALSLVETMDYAQDVLDLIEFANGDAASEWGSIRAEMGHPEPFNVKYLEIGNENWGMTYWSRFDIVYRAVKEQYPEITIIASGGPDADSATLATAWATVREGYTGSMVDERYIRSGSWFLNNLNRYAEYPKDGKVLVGAYAARDIADKAGRYPNSLFSALYEAAFLTGLERSGEAVGMASYGPLLARDGAQHTTPNLIWFNAREVLLTPNYHVQRMFANALGNQVVKSYYTGFNKSLYHVVTRTDKLLYIKVVNMANEEEEMDLALTGVVDENAWLTILTGQKNDTNTFGSKNRVSPVDDVFPIKDGVATVKLPPYSVAVMTFNIK